MKMKNIFSLAVIALAALSSCSNIAEDERFIPGEMVGGGETVEGKEKNILIEDFTGQNCVNCPLAMEELEKLHITFGEKIIAVGVYGGPFGKSATGKYYPLTTDLGDYYNTKMDISEQPYANINRKEKSSNYIAWKGIVALLLEEEAKITLSCENTYDSASGTAAIKVSGDALSTIDDAHLQVWIIEDNVVSLQRLPDGSVNKEFRHNHVLRTSVSDKDGDPISIAEGKNFEKTYSATIDSSYKPEDLYVVAFIFSANGVEQVVKEKLVKAE